MAKNLVPVIISLGSGMHKAYYNTFAITWKCHIPVIKNTYQSVSKTVAHYDYVDFIKDQHVLVMYFFNMNNPQHGYFQVRDESPDFLTMCYVSL